MRGRKSPEMGSQVGQGEQKTKEISECERKIQKIKTMRGEIALAHGVFQQPASRGVGLGCGLSLNFKDHLKCI